MTNTFYPETQVWVVDEIGTLNTGGVTVLKVQFHSKNAGDQIVITDNADKPAIKIWCGVGDGYEESDFGPKGKRLNSLKVATLSGGCTAYIHFRTDID